MNTTLSQDPYVSLSLLGIKRAYSDTGVPSKLSFKVQKGKRRYLNNSPAYVYIG